MQYKTEKLEKLLLQYTSVYKISDSRIDEEELEKKIELIDKEYDKIDNEFYQYGDAEIDKK